MVFEGEWFHGSFNQGEGEPAELSTKRPVGTESLTIHMVRPGGTESLTIHMVRDLLLT